MDAREIAKELVIACLRHGHHSAYFRPQGTEKTHAVIAGERVGESYDPIWKALAQELLASNKPTG
jgi:hypothetical protein